MHIFCNMINYHLDRGRGKRGPSPSKNGKLIISTAIKNRHMSCSSLLGWTHTTKRIKCL